MIKGFTPHPLRFAQHLLHGRRQTPQSLCDSSPFMGAFPNRKPSLKGKVASVAWRKALKISQMDLQKMQWNCILPKVLLNFFQKIFRVWGETPRSFSSINLYLYLLFLNPLEILFKCFNLKIVFKSIQFFKYVVISYSLLSAFCMGKAK